MEDDTSLSMLVIAFAISAIGFAAGLFCGGRLVGRSTRGVAAAVQPGKIDDWSRESIRSSAHELQQFLDAIPVQIWCGTPEGAPLAYNKRWRDYSGMDANQFALGREGFDDVMRTIIHPDDLGPGQAELAECYATGASYSRLMRVRRADGEYRCTDNRAEPLRDADGTILRWYGICLDVEDKVRSENGLREREIELRSIQEQLSEAARKASLAELSAAIAHEISQPLTAINSNAEASIRWLAMEPANIDRAKASIENAKRGVEDAVEIVNSIRSLFRHSTGHRYPGDMNSLIMDVARIIGATDLGARIGVVLDLAPKLPPVVMDKVQIQQILMNLIRNALEAVNTAEGGRDSVRVRSLQEGASILIEVIDEGIGFPADSPIGEAYFTTKSQGMGMGLSISKTIAKAHGGDLWHRPNEPRGAVFSFKLPLVQRQDAV